MTTKTEIKELLARAITKIDEWDLVHGCEEVNSIQVLKNAC